MRSYIEDLKNILNELNVYNKASELKPEDDLFSLGVLDSLILIQFVISIENHLKIRFPNDLITYDNFSTLLRAENLIREIKTKTDAKSD